jgi:hypothetical protein
MINSTFEPGQAALALLRALEERSGLAEGDPQSLNWVSTPGVDHDSAEMTSTDEMGTYALRYSDGGGGHGSGHRREALAKPFLTVTVQPRIPGQPGLHLVIERPDPSDSAARRELWQAGEGAWASAHAQVGLGMRAQEATAARHVRRPQHDRARTRSGLGLD